MKKVTLQFLKSKKGKDFLAKNSHRSVWIHTDNGFWGRNGCGYPISIEHRGVYSLLDAYSRTNHCGPEKFAVYHFVDANHNDILQAIQSHAEKINLLTDQLTSAQR